MYVFACIVLAPLLWWLIILTEFQTDVVFRSDGNRVSWSICGDQPVEINVPFQRLTQIEIFAEESVFPVGGKDLRIEQAGKVVFQATLPGRFSTPVFSSGDWWIDKERGKPIRVFAQNVDVQKSFVLQATFTGRSFRPTVIVLHGNTTLRLRFFRGLLNNLYEILEPDGKVLAGFMLHVPSVVSFLNILNIIFHGLFASCLLVLSFSALAALRLKTNTGWNVHHGFVVVILGALFLGVCVWTAVCVLENIPHFQDDLNYVLRAKWLLAGRLYQPEPAYSQNLLIPSTVFWKQRWVSAYPIHWPLLLAIGLLVKLPWLVSVLSGATTTLLIYRLGARLYGKEIGLRAFVAAVLSPICILMSASLMNHAAGSLLVLLFFYLFASNWSEVPRSGARPWKLLAAGICAGYVFGMRPLTAIAISVPAALFVLLDLIRFKFDRRFVVAALAIVGGALLGSSPALVDNYIVAGGPLRFMYRFAEGRWSLPDGLINTDSAMATILPMAFGWGWKWISGWQILSLTLAFAFVPFLTGKANKWDYLLLMTFLSLPIAYAPHRFIGGHAFGPRFYYEVFFCLFLLTARGFFLLGNLNRASIARPVANALFILLSLSTALTLPERLKLYKGYNDVDRALERAIKAQKITRAVVLLGNENWRDWNNAANLLPGSFDSDLIIAGNATDNSALFETYADRPVYLWSAGSLKLYPRHENDDLKQK